MGPFLLVDKSFIESLSFEEIDILDKHYTVILVPILLREICANLLKYPDDEKLSKNKVSLISKKAQGFDAKTICHYGNILIADLLGERVPLKPIIPRTGGRECVAPDGSKGIIFDESFEDQLLRRWANGIFKEEDYLVARDHYNNREYDLKGSGKQMASEYPRNSKYGSLDELATHLDYINSVFPNQEQLVDSFLSITNVDPKDKIAIKTRWQTGSYSSFGDFAKYAFYCFRLGSVFWVAVTSGLIPTSKHAKAIIDYEYLYYLPFVHAFCSRDNFQRDLSRYFLRTDQDFIWGDDLRSDLQVIKEYKNRMTDSDKRLYEIHFGHYPPPIADSITYDIWSRRMRPWTLKSGNLAIEMPKEVEKGLIAKIETILNSANK
jgi:hypothetical protein